MLSLPIKLTRDQTRLLKKENLVCVGVGAEFYPNWIFKGGRIDCYYISLEEQEAKLSRDHMTGSCTTFLYFLPRAKAASLGLTERSDLIVPYVAKPRAPKPAYRYALLGDNLIEKFTPSTYQVIYKSSGPNGREQSNCPLATIESRIKSGNMKELTHAEFVAKINSWGWNEDGTKFVPPAPAPEATMNDVWAAFCAYTAKSGNAMHHLRIYDDNSGSIRDMNTVILDFNHADGFAGIVAKIKAATK